MGTEETSKPKETSKLTPEFRVSYPNVFKAKLNDLSGKEEYSLAALFPKGADLSNLKKLVHEALVKKWGLDQAKWPKVLRSPFRDQAERAKVDEDTGKETLPLGYEAGAIFINLKSAKRPGVVDHNVQRIIQEADFYAGCYARASVNAYAYDAKGNKGVAFGLGNIQKIKDGDPLGGRARAEDDFQAIEGTSPSGEGADATSLF